MHKTYAKNLTCKRHVALQKTLISCHGIEPAYFYIIYSCSLKLTPVLEKVAINTEDISSPHL